MRRQRNAITWSLCACILAVTGCGSSTPAYQYQAEDVTAKLKKADTAYGAEDYSKAADLYLDAMESDPKNIDARLGDVRCRIAMEQYGTALSDLGIAAMIDPQNDDIYDLYLQISDEQGTHDAAMQALSVARQYGNATFLAKVPAEPSVSLAGGSYDSPEEIELSTDDDSAEIYYSLHNEDHSLRSVDLKYNGPIHLYRGTTTVTAYSLKDSIPSDELTVEYKLDYEPRAVTFSDPIMEKVVRQQLDLPEGDITDEQLETITELETNNLQNDADYSWDKKDQFQIESYEDLNQMPYLQELYVRENQKQFPDLSNINLPYLDCIFFDPYSYDSGTVTVKSLDTLTNQQSLTAIRTLDCDVLDISAVNNLPYLRKLYIDSAKVQNLTETLSKKTLQYVEFNGDALQDYSTLIANKNITYVEIDGWNFDRDALGQMTWLTELDLDGDYSTSDSHELKDLSFLTGMKNLQYLYLRYVNDPVELEPLKSMTWLQELRLYNCKAVDDHPDVLAELQEALPNTTIDTD